ncbi:hypothetical protein BD289DRAFT_373298 [Coniella lustricola]|uniref:Peroxisomal biogenesis factor 11 n=1 Tax=Coniella lustricola TaxID=2025994 RepID=A0A2T3A130_9PEZI|nr:hypothetical protein BD289DRAFT_373298 [Coniella lustricola]
MSAPTSSAPENLPTGEPVPANERLPTPSSPSSSSSSLATALASSPNHADAFLAHLQRCLATPSGIDTILLFICYTSRLSAALCSHASSWLLRHGSARDLLAIASLRPFLLARPPTAAHQQPTTIIIKTVSHPVRLAAARLAALLATRLKNLGSLASEARTIARLWALLGMYFWARRLVGDLVSSYKKKDAKPQDGVSGQEAATSTAVTLVSWAQLISCTAFQYLENRAYLSGRGVLGWTPQEQGRAYVVGSRWLAVYTGLEIGKLLATMLTSSSSSPASSKTEKGGAAAEAEAAIRRSMAINLAWTPLTLHWATEGGFLTDLAVGAGGCIPGVLQMRKLWKSTAE